jgi:hypothetical protein
VGANAGVNAIGVTVQFDANVLQVRAGSEGDRAAGSGLDAHFAAEISGEEDRMQIRSAVSGPRIGMAGGSVAIVRFQAVAPGTTSVMTTDVKVFLPAGLLLMVAGLGKFAYDVTVRGLSESALVALVGPLAIWAVGIVGEQNMPIQRTSRCCTAQWTGAGDRTACDARARCVSGHCVWTWVSPNWRLSRSAMTGAGRRPTSLPISQ